MSMAERTAPDGVDPPAGGRLGDVARDVLRFYSSTTGGAIGAAGAASLVPGAGRVARVVRGAGIGSLGVLVPLRLMLEQRRLAAREVATGTQLSRELAALRADLAQVRDEVATGAGSARTLAARLDRVEARAEETVATLQVGLAGADRAGGEAASRLAGLEQRTDELLGERIQPFSRHLDFTAAEDIAAAWNAALGGEVSRQHVTWLAHHIRERERIALGRFASTVGDIVSRILVGRAQTCERMDVLEIGTLFGIGGLVLHEALRPFCGVLVTTVVDPFEGYYGNELDRSTGLPVTLDVFETNRKIFGIDAEEIRTIVGLSEDPGTVSQAADRSYELVIIDGDHSYDGVRRDIELYGPMLAPDGLMIVDDYGNDDWPGVTRHVDELLESGKWTLVGHHSRTAVIRPV